MEKYYHCLEAFTVNKIIKSLIIAAALVPACLVQAAGKNLPAPTTAGNNVVINHAPYTAIYQAVYKNFPLQATHRLEQAGNDWYFSSIASGFFGQIEEDSTFSFTDSGISPLHYMYRRSILGQEKESELIYNHKDNVAAGSKGNKSFTVKLQGDELDMGTYMLALRDDIARGIQAPCYKVIDQDDVENYCFKVTGRETIETALGKMDTVTVERIRKAQSPRNTRFWLAPSLGYNIVKLEHQEEKGKNAYSLEITYYKQENAK